MSGCDLFKEEKKPVQVAEPKVEVNADGLLNAANLYAYTQVSEALNRAQALDSMIASLLHHPNPVSIEETQKSWIAAYNTFLKIRFLYSVPRFEKPEYHEQGATYRDITIRLDSWPIEPGYIDYLPGYPLSGIVNDLTLKVSLDNLLDQHGFSDPRYASVGFHPLEFLLFGVNGKRSAKDFIPQENTVEVVATEPELQLESPQGSGMPDEMVDKTPVLDGPQNHNRRRDYIRILSADIVKQLQILTDRWDPANGYYAKQWRQPEAMSNVSQLYQGLINVVQTEILEQHFVLLSQPSLDDLRSPYSNSDTQNIQALLAGVENLMFSDKGFNSEIHRQDAELADKITAQFKRLMHDMQQLPSDWTSLNAEQRIAQLAPAKQKLIQLLDLMYSGAEVLGVQLQALPISTH